ncbi:hypothetical protein [Gymnodinialimonas ceratoperidinii]|uniref:Uncharacterized protein n=1 Tax=Gymnodinialimonas ceratoperidinii TaxID=2856823 RepID=A0A8F6TUL0_9RHOB|nr:hypothetical protein [Gymnodinialimonas ceratoperidinii]QXT38743.1 hypothetical protein KYE46_12465 [Gymnodinialimonas ceratoperidinii]
MPQPKEESSQIFILIIDETYGGDDDAWEEESHRFRRSLERDFDCEFAEANIGPGADIPAFLTIIATTTVPIWTVLLGAFFLGKPISENLTAWSEIGGRLRSFFGRQVVLARNGAAAIAVEAVFEELGGLPKTIRLLSYRPGHIGDDERIGDMPQSDSIQENVPTLNLGYVRHIFEIEADGVLHRVTVDGKNTEVLKLQRSI